MDGWNLAHKGESLSLWDWAKLVAHNFRHGTLEWWKDNIAYILEMTEWFEEIDGQTPTPEVNSVKEVVEML